jgi:hypothetical protein
LLIVEVEEVGRVVYSVRGLSFTNHPALNPSWFKISVHQRSGIFDSYLGTAPAIFKQLGDPSLLESWVVADDGQDLFHIFSKDVL